jgi:hypothetical protein
VLRNLFTKKKDKAEDNPKINQVSVVLPVESYTIMEWKNDGLPCIAMLNSALKAFEHKNVFTWHLSVIIDFDELIDNGMPSEDERKVVDPFCDKLDEEIKAGGNALFFVRETWNKTRRLVWRVYDPEIADQHLQYIVKYHKYPRPFDWHMEQDMEWEQTKWYFSQLKT